jgi:uncharacterized membrane protein
MAVVTSQPEQPDPSEHAAMGRRLARLELLIGLGRSEAEEVAHRLPAWLRETRGESRWPVALSMLIAIALQAVLRNSLSFQPRYLLPALELLLFIVLAVANPERVDRESSVLRASSLLLVVAASLATAWSAGRLVWQLVHGMGGTDPMVLLLNGGSIWLTNVIVFALWYWEFDRGGPAARAHARVKYPDFLFAQMTAPELVHRDWEPSFVDYLYLSFTNATAFSPTDTLPLSRWAKLTMMFQSAISLIVVALVVARAVNIL